MQIENCSKEEGKILDAAFSLVLKEEIKASAKYRESYYHYGVYQGDLIGEHRKKFNLRPKD